MEGVQHSKINGGQIRAQLPYIRTDVPVVLVFRALGYTNDKAILEHIVYDFTDTDMMEKFRCVSLCLLACCCFLLASHSTTVWLGLRKSACVSIPSVWKVHGHSDIRLSAFSSICC